ncbi:MAG: AtpZ/AtpI family protein [Deltaproteobacteria bacterium]|jgi:ATP synthase protein I|nr:AtpZ/AtpI family protein [Deltaproteobacteria bacterium]
MLSPKALKVMARASAMVLEMGILVVVGAFSGNWLDGRLGTSPLFLLCLSMAMLVAGIFRILRTLEHDQDTDDS